MPISICMVLAGVFMAVYYFFVEIFHSLFTHEVSEIGHCKPCDYKHFFLWTLNTYA